MKMLFRWLLRIVLFAWELPQNIAGLATYLNLKLKRKILNTEFDQERFFIETPHRGVSLGLFVFWTKRSNRYNHLTNDCKLHEFGHSVQSRVLGPLYLVIVGLPSAMRHIYSIWYIRKTGTNWNAYYDGFPENQADKLGGVKP
jgi:hypothetical protein